MRRTKIAARLLLALALPVLAAVALALVAQSSGRRADFLLERAEKAFRQLDQLEGLGSDMDRRTLEAILATDAEQARAILTDLDRTTMHRLGVLDRLTEEEIAFVDEGERETEMEERARPAALRAAAERVLAAAAPVAAETAGSRGDRGAARAALAEAHDDFTALIADAVADERAEVDAAQSEIAAMRAWLRLSAVAWPLAAMMAVAGVGVPLMLSISRRISRLKSAVAAIGRGELDHRLGPLGADELGFLAAGINDMAARLEADRDHRANYERELEDEIDRRAAQLAATNARLREIDATRRRFLGDIGHALKTPLAVAKTTLEAAEQRRRDGRLDAGPLTRSIEAVDAVADRIAELLALAKAEDGRLTRRLERLELYDVADARVAAFARLPDRPRLSLC